MCDPPGELVELTRAECLQRLAGEVIGRIVYTSAALPAVQPVNFAVDHDGAVIIRTVPGSRLARGARDAIVAFEVDEFDVAGRTGWSVIVTGHAQVVRDAAELARLQALPLAMWADGHRDEYIRISPDLVTGRRVLPAIATA